jgi:hypothetical protein
MRSSLIRVILSAAIVGSAMAAVPSMAAVNPPGQVLSAQAIQQFMANPSALLSQYPNGGPNMIKAVRDLAGSDPQTLGPLIQLLSQANPDQSTAIGNALGQIALAAVDTDPNYADQIQTAVVRSGNISAEVAFSAVVGGNIKLTAATGGVGGGAETSTTGGTTGFSVGTPAFGPLAIFPNVPDTFSTTSFSGTAGSSPVSP